MAHLVLDKKATLAEGALWDHKNKVLYWVDIEKGMLYVYDPEKEKNQEFDLGQKVGTVVPVDTGGLLVALQDGIYRFNPDTGEKQKMVHPEKDVPGNRYNDGKCDPAGRFWVGSMGLKAQKHAAALYRIDSNFSWKKMIDKVTISNGIVWSIDQTQMYFIDTPTGKVMAYDYDHQTGDISNPRVAIKVPSQLGHPDGSTLDAEGKLWIAMYRGYAVTRWDPENGKLLERIEVPAPNITSCAFGDRNLKTLYITTARSGMSEEQLQVYPHSGGLFKVKPRVKGIKANYFKTVDA